MEKRVKKKLINWIILLVVLILIMLGVRWAENKRHDYFEHHQKEQLP